MKDASSVTSSFITIKKDYQEYDFSIQSILSAKEEASIRKKRKSSAFLGESSDSDKGKVKKVRGKVIVFKENEESMKSDTKKCEYEEEMTEIQSIKNISILKERNKKGDICYFFRINGKIIKVTESNNDDEMFVRTDYEQMDIPIEDFNSDLNPISGKDNLQNIIPILMKFAEFLKSFIDVSNLIHHQFKLILKPVDLDTYIVFILLNIRKVNFQSETKESLKNIIMSITFEELEDNIPHYIDYVLEKFYLPVPNKCPSNLSVYRILETIIPDMTQVTSDINKLGKFGSFSILTEMSEIVTKIENELFLVFKEKELINNDKAEFKTNLINKLFYLMLIQMNNFFKKTYPICCNYEKDTLLNYAKEPYILCFDCKAIICHRCFYLHRNHNYFDFACTIKKKFANIHSSLNRFLNYKKNDSSSSSFGKISSINIEYAEDHIQYCILRGLESIAEDYLMSYIKNNLANNESGYMTILHFIDFFLLEYLYKGIFPYKHNPNFLSYDLKLKCLEDRNNLLNILLVAQDELLQRDEEKKNHREKEEEEETEKTDLYFLYTDIREKVRKEKKVKKVQSIIQKIKPKIFNLDDLFCETKITHPYDNVEPFFFNQSLTNNNFIDSSLEDFEQVKANYSKLRYQIQKLKAKEKNDLLKELPASPTNMRASNKMIALGKTDPFYKLKEKKAGLSNWVNDKIDWIFYKDNFAFELKWYYAYKDEEDKCTKVKFIDGMGSLYQYVMSYFDEVIGSAANFGTYCFSNKTERDNDDENHPINKDDGLNSLNTFNIIT